MKLVFYILLYNFPYCVGWCVDTRLFNLKHCLATTGPLFVEIVFFLLAVTFIKIKA